MFEAVDLTKKLSKRAYKRRMPVLQHRLWEMQRAGWKALIPSIWVFDGWDAAGKGPCIRKLTERLEPRGFELHHVTDEPRTHELELPWMWRFWRDQPRRGQIAIFDRSWNRRALIDRVSGAADEMRWRRALRDICDFERMLSDDGYVIIKFFLHIGQDEQMKRYERWKKDPADSWKALEGGWQKPTHYQEHLAASEELLQHTELPQSPWTIVPATDQRWVRITVLEKIISRLESALAESGLTLPAASADLPPDDDDDDDFDEGENV